MRHFLAVLLAAAALAAALASPAAAARTVFTGQWQCDDRGTVVPLPDMEIQLWKRGDDFWPVEWSGRRITTAYTDADGRFRLTTPDEPDRYFVRMALRDGRGIHLKDWIGINDWSVDSEGRRNDVAVQDLGGLLLGGGGTGSPKCMIWRGVSQSNAEFQRLIPGGGPWGSVTINADAPTAGTPFTPGTSIWWAGNYPTGYYPGEETTPRHEFGHVIRHGYDGDLGHFLLDVGTFNYLQHHQACNKTNSGFAFNEGWAEYWAADYWPAPNCTDPVRAPDDYEVEGNVAAALTALQSSCGSSRAGMIDVLRRNPGAIHSLVDFRNRLTCVAAGPPPPPPPPEPEPLPIAPATLAASFRAQVAATDVRIRRLVRSLSTATRVAARARCVAPRCATSFLRAVTRPPALRGELALARLGRASLDDFDTLAEQQKIEVLTPAILIGMLKAKEKANRTKSVTILKTAVRGMLKAGRPAFRLSKSRKLGMLEKDWRRKLSQLLKVNDTTPLPVFIGVQFDPMALKKPQEVPAKVFPVPTPSPTPAPTQAPAPTPTPTATATATPDPRTAQSLTLNCPSDGSKAGDYQFTGVLSPGRENVSIDLHFTPPNSPEVVQVTKTGVQGNYSATRGLTPGTWTVFARVNGDDAYQPADSPSCTFTIT